MSMACTTNTRNIVLVRPIRSDSTPAIILPLALPIASNATRMKPAADPL